jgi:AAA ATPase domain
MDPVRNPYAPGAGTRPPELAGRQEILNHADIAIRRVQAGRFAKSFIFIGLRGVGKTVLLNEVVRIADRLGCKTLYVEATDRKPLPALLVPLLRQLLLSLDTMEKATDATRRGLRVLKSFVNSVKVSYGGADFGMSIPPEKGVADSGDLQTDLTALLVAVGEAAKSRKSTVVIAIDELQYLTEEELSALIMAIHRTCAQLELPIILAGAGLPQLVGQMGTSRSYAERLFNFPPIGALDPADARLAIKEPASREGVEYTSEALDEIVRVSAGYPYFLQEWGYHAWDIAKGPGITEADSLAAHTGTIASLDQNFFKVRLDRLTPTEKNYLRAMAELGPGPHRSGDIAEKLGVLVSSVAPLRSGLIKKGMIYSQAHGDTAFTVPLFDQYMKRAIPEMPKKKRRKKAK